jgi:hypothetical protein
MCVDQAVLVGMRGPRLGPRLHRKHALCGPCVSRTGLSPSVCGRRTLAELHIQDIGLRMLPTSAALGRGASCRHPCCSFPCSALGAHGTLHSPLRGKHLCVLCTTNAEVRRCLRKEGKGRMGTIAALRNVPEQTSWKAEKAKLALMEFSEIHVWQESYFRLYEP